MIQCFFYMGIKKTTILERKKYNGKIMEMELRPSPDLEVLECSPKIVDYTLTKN